MYIKKLVNQYKMFILTQKSKGQNGAYAVLNESDEEVLYIFQEEDDAVRYAMMLEDCVGEMDVLEIDDEAIIKTCVVKNHKFAIITPNDIVIPPETEHDFI